MPETSESLIALRDAYLAADYRWQHGGHWFPLGIGAPAGEIGIAFPDAMHFGVITAWNPRSVPQLEQVNRDADHAMHDALESSGLAYRPAFAAARNRSWKESSWLVIDMPLPGFDALARRFGQLSTLWWQSGKPLRLRMYAAMPAMGEHAFVDWIK
ncbi:MAG: DUF3293 domain-containing protein [Luteimonas sp.]